MKTANRDVTLNCVDLLQGRRGMKDSAKAEDSPSRNINNYMPNVELLLLKDHLILEDCGSFCPSC